MNPYSELEKAIITKLKAASDWLWPIFGNVMDPGTLYLHITNVTGADASAKVHTIRDFFISFDAWDLRMTANIGTSEDVMEVLYIMETIITLDNHDSGLTALSLGGGFVDVSHQPGGGPDILPNPDQGIKHARQIVKFKLALPT